MDAFEDEWILLNFVDMLYRMTYKYKFNRVLYGM